MSLLSSAGKLLKSVGKKFLKKITSKEADLALSLTPIGAVKGVGSAAPKALGAAEKLGSGALKAAKFLFVGETAVKSVKKSAATLGLAAVVAGGGLKLVPYAFGKVKGATEKVVDYVVPATPAKQYGSEIPGYVPNQFTPINKKKAPIASIGEVIGAGLGGAAIGGLIGYGAEKLLNKNQPSSVLPAAAGSQLPSSPMVSNTLPAPIPITPPTQTVQAGSPRRRRSLAKKSSESPRITFRNQNINIIGKYAS